MDQICAGSISWNAGLAAIQAAIAIVPNGRRKIEWILWRGWNNLRASEVTGRESSERFSLSSGFQLCMQDKV
jgi:hypothetical protein